MNRVWNFLAVLVFLAVSAFSLVLFSGLGLSGFALVVATSIPALFMGLILSLGIRKPFVQDQKRLEREGLSEDTLEDILNSYKSNHTPEV